MRVRIRAGPVSVSGRVGTGAGKGCLGFLGVILVVGVIAVAAEYLFGWPAILLAHHRASGAVRWGAEVAWLFFLLVVAPLSVFLIARKAEQAKSR